MSSPHRARPNKNLKRGPAEAALGSVAMVAADARRGLGTYVDSEMLQEQAPSARVVLAPCISIVGPAKPGVREVFYEVAEDEVAVASVFVSIQQVHMPYLVDRLVRND